MLGSLAVAGLLTLRIEWGARFNTAMVFFKIAAVILVIAAGLPHVRTANWHPFMPYGFKGVAEGAAVVFFAVFGYDTLTTAAEEARDPQQQLPRRCIALARHRSRALHRDVFGAHGRGPLRHSKQRRSGCRRVRGDWPALGDAHRVRGGGGGHRQRHARLPLGLRPHLVRDEPRWLLPAWFAQVHKRFRTPHRPTLIAGGLTALVAGFFPLKEVAELVNIGTLSAFMIICLAVIVLRRTKPGVRRTFRTPLVPWTPLAGIGFSLWLLSKLPAVAWELFVIWMGLGLLLYFSYGRRHSVLAQRESASIEGQSAGAANGH